jgi:hypothetical protein
MRTLAALILLTLSSSPVFAACGSLDAPVSQHLTSENHQLRYVVEPAPLAVARDFAMIFDVCNGDGSAFEGTPVVDAHMPRHRHGMNYRPRVEKLGDGRFRADGFLFHMPGQWQFIFDLNDGPSSERLTSDLLLK